MRWISRLLVILIVCLVAVALPAAPAQAASPYISLSPPSGVPGDEVTVQGHNFTANTGVDVYYYLDTINSTDRKRIEVETDDDGYFIVIFEVPESYKGVHEVRAYIDTTLQTTGNFTVKPGLTISPTEGPVGKNATVQGHGFAKNETGIKLIYYLDGNYTTIAQNISADGDGWWQTSFLVLSSARGSHKIDAQGASSSFAQVRDVFFEVTPEISFEVTPGISRNESSGTVGENITMTGNGFYPDDSYIKILFEDKEVQTEIIRADDNGYWQGNFEVPEMPIGTYNITAYGELTPKAAVTALRFEIKPGLVLLPDEGHVGTDLTISGYGFPSNEDVNIMYDGSPIETAETDDNGSFDNVSFVVPESQHGGHNITAEDAVGNNATAIFTMESVPPPVPELKSPPDGSRVGFIGKVRPTFNWSAVSDPSGVYYSLQIAASANVTTTGNFTDPLVLVPNIVGTNYTLNATDALPYGTYYWIVQAVDRAGNAGNWTAAYSFHTGGLPLWAFILLIVAAVAIIGTLVYFLVIRRRVSYY
ncbi:MAG TPA: hypothetical protein VEG43_02670 [Dehalococcoidia bacterium]|nr:hypothetical protein [Dehalococcoidia bacterium]